MILLSFIIYTKKILLISFSYLPSGIKILFYRFMGARIGKNVELGLGSYIIPYFSGLKNISIGNNVLIGDHVHIRTRNLRIGDDCEIKDNSLIWGQSDFSAGTGVYIDQECHFDLRRTITLGNDVIISGGCWFYTHMVYHSVLKGSPSKFGSISIQDRTYVGANVFVLPGITIGNDVIIGARSVVTKNVQSDSVVVGDPAKEIDKTSLRTRTVTFEDKIVIVKDILEDFMQIFREKILLIKEWDSNELIFTASNQVIFYLPRSERFPDAYEKIKEFKKPVTLISFSLPKEIIDKCDTSAISWFDLASGTKSSRMHTIDHALMRFFGGYGIKIT